MVKETNLLIEDNGIKSTKEQDKEWEELERNIKLGDENLLPKFDDFIEKGVRSEGYPNRKGTILVTKELKSRKSLTGHAGIIYNSTTTIECFPKEASPDGINGVYTYSNDWNIRYGKNTYAVNVRGTTQEQDDKSADYAYRRYEEGRPYNWVFTDIENGSKFYCSQLCYKAFMVMNSIDINNNGGIVYPIDLINDDDTYIIWSNQ